MWSISHYLKPINASCTKFLTKSRFNPVWSLTFIVGSLYLFHKLTLTAHACCCRKRFFLQGLKVFQNSTLKTSLIHFIDLYLTFKCIYWQQFGDFYNQLRTCRLTFCVDASAEATRRTSSLFTSRAFPSSPNYDAATFRIIKNWTWWVCLYFNPTSDESSNSRASFAEIDYRIILELHYFLLIGFREI